MTTIHSQSCNLPYRVTLCFSPLGLLKPTVHKTLLKTVIYCYIVVGRKFRGNFGVNGTKGVGGPLEKYFFRKVGPTCDLRHKRESECSGAGVTGKNTYFQRTLILSQRILLCLVLCQRPTLTVCE